jgi:hypothetical protein
MPLQGFQDFVWGSWWTNPLNVYKSPIRSRNSQWKGEMKVFKQRLARGKGQGQGNNNATKIIWTASGHLSAT